MEKLLEIKKNNVGTGLLIESDGCVYMPENERNTIRESIEVDRKSFPDPFIVPAIFQKYDTPNANNRIYPENILRREVEKYQRMIEERRALAELNHPAESTIDLGRISHSVVELHWEGKTLVGKIMIPVTDGFRNMGICSTCADQLAHLLLSGFKIGLSSRGVGSVEQRFGKYIVGDDFELICFDSVSDPSTPGAWIGKEKEELQQYVEEKERYQPSIMEKLNHFDDWLGLN